MTNNNNLIERELRVEFNCVKCRKLLSPPIMLIDTVGDMCFTCYYEKFVEKNKATEKKSYNLIVMDEVIQPSIRNTALERIMKFVRSHCMNQQKGCPFVSDLVALRSHESQCEYRKIECALRGCQWSGSKNLYVDHLLQTKHESNESVGQSEDPTLFPLNGISLQKETEDIVILKTISGLFLFHYKVYACGIRMKCAVCRIEKECEELEDESINIEFVLNDGWTLSYKKCCIIDQIEQFKNFDEYDDNDITFNIDHFMERSRDFSIRLRQNIKGKYIRDLPLELQNLIRKGVNAEKIENFIRVECDNVDKGCYICPLKRDEHSLYCKYQFWKCPCNNHFEIADAAEHFINVHKYNHLKDTGPRIYENILNINYGYYLDAFNCIFNISTHCTLGSLKFVVEKLGVNRKEKFCCKIIIKTETSSSTTLAINVPVSTSGTTEHCVDVNSLVKLFGSSENIILTEEIRRIM